MENSLFHRKPAETAPLTPQDLIGPEIVHLKKGASTRQAGNAPAKSLPWLIILAVFGLGGLYILDPVEHAWYKGEAVRAYLYLHNYGTESQTKDLVATHIFSLEEVDALNRRQGSVRNYYVSPDAANQRARTIIHYMNNVSRLHDGKYEQLGRLGKLRYLLFIQTGLTPPTDWSFLDPTVGN